LGDTGENLFANFMVLCAFPDAEYVCSNFHAGQGCVSFGSNYRRKADLMVSVEEDKVEMEDESKIECCEVAPGQWQRRPPQPKRPNKRRFLRFGNYHGIHWHGAGDGDERDQHVVGCPAAAAAAKHAEPDEGDLDTVVDVGTTAGGGGRTDAGNNRIGIKRSRSLASRQGISATDLTGEAARLHKEATMKKRQRVGPTSATTAASVGEARDDEDDLKKEYAEALTAVDPERLVVTYDVVYECDLLHGKTCPDPSRWNKLTRGKHRLPKHNNWAKYKTVREYLATEHKEDTVLGSRHKSFTQKNLIKKILDSGYNSEKGNEFGGFVVITGGRETREDDGLIPRSFGFCHQRSPVGEANIGSFTKMQVRMQCGGNESLVNKTLKQMGDQPRTAVKTSFPEQGGEVLTMDYLRFLIHERGLTGFRVRHAILYKIKHYLSPFVVDMLQQRYDLQGVPDSEMLRILLKLVINGE
jgi:hypothetical protein